MLYENTLACDIILVAGQRISNVVSHSIVRSAIRADTTHALTIVVCVLAGMILTSLKVNLGSR